MENSGPVVAARMEASAQPVCSLYVHVPFCRSRCTYCDFHSAVLSGGCLTLDADCTDSRYGRVHAWLQSIADHLSMLRLTPGWKPYTTIYVGGGTPSSLPHGVLEKLLSLLANSWAGAGTGSGSHGHPGGEAGLPVDHGNEWTIECNPDDLDGTMLDSFMAFGVNRLSVGVQSLEDPVRQAVLRRGRAAEILSALENLGRGWKRRWSADFMYGMPFQTPGGLAQDIKRIIDLGAGHISLYQLTLEEGTVLANEVRHGIISLPDPDLSADQYEAATEVLQSAGYHRYEVSNWALPGQSCLHNLHYWRMDDWDAVGPAGVSNRRDGISFIRGQNSSSDESYEADPTGSVEISVVDGVDAMFEFLMMALRTSEGFSIRRFVEIFGRDPVLLFGDLPAIFPALLDGNSGHWRPNGLGMDFLNRVLVSALESAESSMASGSGRSADTAGSAESAKVADAPVLAEENAGPGGFPS